MSTSGLRSGLTILRPQGLIRAGTINREKSLTAGVLFKSKCKQITRNKKALHVKRDFGQFSHNVKRYHVSIRFWINVVTDMLNFKVTSIDIFNKNIKIKSSVQRMRMFQSPMLDRGVGEICFSISLYFRLNLNLFIKS